MRVALHCEGLALRRPVTLAENTVRTRFTYNRRDPTLFQSRHVNRGPRRQRQLWPGASRHKLPEQPALPCVRDAGVALNEPHENAYKSHPDNGLCDSA